MAIPPADLELWTGDEEIDGGGRLGLSLDWQVRHAALQEVIERGELEISVAKQADLLPAWGELMTQAGQQLENVRALHEPIAGIGGWSLFDVNLIFDAWVTDGANYEHPLSGTIAGPIPGTLPGRLNAILAAVAPPPLWFWSDSPGAGQLRVRCVAVAGAVSYDVYSGLTKLGNVPDHNWNTLSVSAGSYSVRMGAVIGGTLGILSFPVQVAVA